MNSPAPTRSLFLVSRQITEVTLLKRQLVLELLLLLGAVLGRHPAKLIPEFVARSARHAAMEGQPSSPLSPKAAPLPKKPVQSVKPRKERVA